VTNKELIQAIRKAVHATAEGGRATINVVDLDRYLAQWEALPLDARRELTQIERDALRAQFEEALANQKLNAKAKLEEWRTIIAAGRRAVKSALLLNGGAAAALLAFIGHLATAQPSTALPTHPAIRSLGLSLLIYVAGLLSTAVSYGAVYVGQTRYFIGKLVAGHVFNFISIGLVILSYVLFAWASLWAYGVFRAL